MLKTLLGCSTALIAGAALGVPAYADEGLWTFDNFPAARVKANYGVDIDKAWLTHVMGAEVRLSNGCSASEVSSRGLVLTDNHCIADCAQNLSGPQHNYYLDGFVAGGEGEEKKCAGLTAEVLTSIVDVTPQVIGAGRGLDGAALVSARTQVEEALEHRLCPDSGRETCAVVELYHGGQYKIYKYRRYDDVRLSFSPGVQASLFGGDPDNFTFPRYDIDAAFIRLYADDRPVATPDHLKWDSSAPRAGELVFVVGNPHRSQRQLTVSQLETERDMSLPYEAVQATELEGRLIRFGEESQDHSRIAEDDLVDLQNHYKYVFARMLALNDEALFQRKIREQDELRAKAGPDLQAEWAIIVRAESARRNLALAHDYVDYGPDSALFDYARILVRGAAERAKPSSERLPNYADAQLPLREKELFDAKPVYPSLEQLQLESWLTRAREYMTVDNPNTTVLLGRKSPEQLSTELSRSTLGDVNVRRQLWNGGMSAVRASDDPMIRYVLSIEPTARALQTQWEETVTGPETRAAEAIARVRFKAYGTDIYPDATGSLRISYGKIEGLTYDGKTVPPFTTFAGLYDRATGEAPYKLGSRWIEAKDKLNLNTIFDMTTTNDTIDGNSGSPLINEKAKVIGLFFDGNIYSLAGDYSYNPINNRAITVSAAAISEALTKVYGDDALVRELRSDN